MTTPVADLALVTPGATDTVVGVDESTGAARRFALTALAAAASYLPTGTGGVSWSVTSKLGEKKSVLDYIPEASRASVQDGTITDDLTAYIQAAFDANDEIEFTDGVYPAIGLTFAGTQMLGPGTIKRYGAGTDPLLTVTSEAAEIVGVRFDGNSAANTQTAAQIVMQGARSKLINCDYTDFYGRIVELDGEGAAIIGGEFHDTGTAANSNCVDLKRRGCAVMMASFTDIGDGHCIRVGYYGADVARSVDGFLIALNRVKTTLHDAFTYELGANRGLTIGNVIDGAEAAYKTELDASIYGLTFCFNTVMNLTGAGTINLKATGTNYHHNYHDNIDQGPFFGDNSRCESNVFRDTGGVGAFVAGNRVDFIDNMFIDPDLALADQLITLTGGCSAVNNRARSSTSLGIGVRASGANNRVIDNSMDGLAQGFAIISSCSASTFRGNEALNCPSQTASLGGDGTNLFVDNIGFGGTTPTKTIASGAITVGALNRTIAVDTEAAAATDDLATITGGVAEQRITLRSANSARDVTAKDGTGNLTLAGDFTFATTADRLMLEYDGTNWVEIGRSTN